MTVCQVQGCDQLATETVLNTPDASDSSVAIAVCPDHAAKAAATGRLDGPIELNPSIGQGERDAFGYRGIPGHMQLRASRLPEGKDPDTLMPVVLLALRLPGQPQRISFALPVELAEGLADELQRRARRAREKHFE